MNVQRPPATIMTSREFNQDTARAKRAAVRGPVFVTSRGRATHVLLTKEEFDRLEGRDAPAEEPKRKSLAEALADNSPEGDFDFEFPEFKGGTFKGFEFG